MGSRTPTHDDRAHDQIELSPELDGYEKDDDDDAPGDALLPLHRSSSHLHIPPTIPRPRLLLGSLVALFTVLAFVLLPARTTPLESFTTSSQPLPLPLTDPLSVTEEWYANFTHPNTGTILFNPARYPAQPPPRQPLSHTLSLDPFLSSSSPACLDQWVASGVMCEALRGVYSGAREPKLDVVWTWVNGSEGERLMKWKEYVAGSWNGGEGGLKEENQVLKLGKGAADLARHFRDHDELRYSIRSILKSFPASTLRTFHLVVGDNPATSPSLLDPVTLPVRYTREAQVPHWLDLTKVELANDGEVASGRVGFRVVPHSSIFKARLGDAQGQTAGERGAEDWRASVLPSFNSLAIESQLPNIPGLGETVLAMNDDLFTFGSLSLGDVASPVLGPVYRMQRGFNVNGVAPGDNKRDPEGEWKSLEMAAWLLDQRFGKRGRPYLMHISKSISTGLWREVHETWMGESILTAETRFRGKLPHEFSSWFLLHHYNVEKHREALLYSFFFGRVDTNQDGLYTPSDRSYLLNLLTPPSATFISNILRIRAPIRETLEHVSTTYAHTGLTPPKRTALEFSSQDGYAYFEAGEAYKRPVPWPSFTKTAAARQGEEQPFVCEIDVEMCFGAGWLEGDEESSVEEVFRRVAFERPGCGDCVIVALLNFSPRGLDAFLPPSSSSEPPTVPTTPEIIGASPSFSTASFLLPPTSSPRDRCLALIQRYSYTIGNSPSHFYAMKSSGNFMLDSAKMDQEGPPAFLALNDDLRSGKEQAVKELDRVFREWMEKQVPERSWWES